MWITPIILLEYLSKKKKYPFEVRVFTSAAGFREYVKEHPVELLLISEKAETVRIREAKIRADSDLIGWEWCQRGLKSIRQFTNISLPIR